MDLIDKIEKCRHLGEEFMIWMLFRSDTQDGIFKLVNGNVVTVFFGDRLTLEAKLAEAERTNLSGGAPAYSNEAKQALRQGKMTTSAKISVVLNENEWSFILNAQRLDISALRIPALLTKKNDEKVYERLALLEQADLLLRGLFDCFLSVRLDEKVWKKESEEINRWIFAEQNDESAPF